MDSNVFIREVKRIRFDLQMREVNVVKVTALSPHFIALTFAGDSLKTFQSAGFGDHVRIVIKSPDGKQVARYYTPRTFDPVKGEIEIEFAVHQGGAMSDWAQQAKVGDAAVIGGPKGSLVFPTDYAHHILIGDPTALPAICRRVEELAVDADIVVFARVDDLADIRSFPTHHNIQTHWVTTEADLLDEIAHFQLPTIDTLVWGGGEQGLMKRIEAFCIDEKGFYPKQVNLCSYWRKGETDFSHH